MAGFNANPSAAALSGTTGLGVRNPARTTGVPAAPDNGTPGQGTSPVALPNNNTNGNGFFATSNPASTPSIDPSLFSGSGSTGTGVASSGTNPTGGFSPATPYTPPAGSLSPPATPASGSPGGTFGAGGAFTPGGPPVGGTGTAADYAPGGIYANGSPGGGPSSATNPASSSVATNPNSVTAGFDATRFATNGPYQGNAMANYDYWLNNPTAAGNPLGANPATVSALSAQGFNGFGQGSGGLGYGGPLQQYTSNLGYGPGGVATNYNPNQFATDQTAQGIASWLGPGYGTGVGASSQQAGGSPFSFPNANYITGPGGQQVNAGTIAGYLNAGWSPSYARQLIGNEFTGAQGPTPSLNPIGSPQAAQSQSYNQAIAQMNSPYGGGSSGVLKGGPNTVFPETAINNGNGTPGLSAADLQSFLQSYGSLAGGAGATAGTGTGAGSIGGTNGSGLDLNQLLSSVLGSGYDLYQRNRNYPTTP